MIRRSAILLVLFTAGGVYAADWPAWRGPTGQGYCTETNLPLKWSGGKMIVYQGMIHGVMRQ